MFKSVSLYSYTYYIAGYYQGLVSAAKNMVKQLNFS